MGYLEEVEEEKEEETQRPHRGPYKGKREAGEPEKET